VRYWRIVNCLKCVLPRILKVMAFVKSRTGSNLLGVCCLSSSIVVHSDLDKSLDKYIAVFASLTYRCDAVQFRIEHIVRHHPIYSLSPSLRTDMLTVYCIAGIGRLPEELQSLTETGSF
jgi:hypothetical protein